MARVLLIAAFVSTLAMPSLAAETSDTTEPTRAKELPRKPSPFVSAAYDSEGGPGFGAGISIPVGSPRSHLRLAAGFSLHFAEVGPGYVPRPYAGYTYTLYTVYTVLRPAEPRNVMYTYAGAMLESRARAAVRPYAGITAGVCRDYSNGRIRQTVSRSPGYVEHDYLGSSNDVFIQVVFGVLSGHGRRSPFLEVAVGNRVRVSAGFRF